MKRYAVGTKHFVVAEKSMATQYTDLGITVQRDHEMTVPVVHTISLLFCRHCMSSHLVLHLCHLNLGPKIFVTRIDLPVVGDSVVTHHCRSGDAMVARGEVYETIPEF
jgi:hypothetical protein